MQMPMEMYDPSCYGYDNNGGYMSNVMGGYGYDYGQAAGTYGTMMDPSQGMMMVSTGAEFDQSAWGQVPVQPVIQETEEEKRKREGKPNHYAPVPVGLIW